MQINDRQNAYLNLKILKKLFINLDFNSFNLIAINEANNPNINIWKLNKK